MNNRSNCLCGKLKWEISAERFTQVFRKICESKMPRLDPVRKIAVIPFGGLDNDPKAKPVDHIYVDYMAKWHEITDDLPVFGEMPD